MRICFALLACALVGCGASTFTSGGPDGGGGDSGKETGVVVASDGGTPPQDASGDVHLDAGPQPGAAETTSQITCGAETCLLPAQICCIKVGNAQCQDGSLPCLGTALHCTSPSNCGPAMKCCIQSGSTGNVALCTAAATCSGGGVPMCDERELPVTCNTLQTCNRDRNTTLGLVPPSGTCGRL